MTIAPVLVTDTRHEYRGIYGDVPRAPVIVPRTRREYRETIRRTSPVAVSTETAARPTSSPRYEVGPETAPTAVAATRRDYRETMGRATPAVASTGRRAYRKSVRRRFSVANVVVAVIVLIGGGVLLYPTAGPWITDRLHADDIGAYVKQVASQAPESLQNILDAASAYNNSIPSGPLRDPYLLNADGSAVEADAGWDDYMSQLSIAGNETMARIRIPKIDVDLPIYHGTDDETLARGIGHLYGSSLPIGGESTNAVLTGHSGFPSATLFTNLDDVVEGDIVYIDVAGETLLYQVDNIEVVDPTDASKLRRVAGKDYVTLLTCTPIGINSHRLLVRAERISDGVADSSGQFIAAAIPPVTMPWWMLGAAALLVAVVWIAWPRRPRRVDPNGRRQRKKREKLPRPPKRKSGRRETWVPAA